MFADSVNDTLFGTKLVLCNESVSADFLNKVKAYLENQGMRLIEVSPTDAQAVANTLFTLLGMDFLILDKRGTY